MAFPEKRPRLSDQYLFISWLLFFNIAFCPGVAQTIVRFAVGDWTERGYPFYSGMGVYACEFDLPAEYCEGKLFLEADCGEDVLEVRINETKSKIAPWHPYRLDVTDVVREGTNSLELCVTNTLINVLEGVRKPSGLFAPVRLTHRHMYLLKASPTRGGKRGKGRGTQGGR